MAKKKNFHTYYIGTEHGRLSFGEVRESNEIAACMLQSGPDGGRHYIVMDETGNAEQGTKGSTRSICPGTFTVKAGKDIVNYAEGNSNPRNIPAIWYEAENGDIIIKAPRGRIKLEAESIELTAQGIDGKSGNILMEADDKIALNAQIVDVKSKVSTKIFSEKTVDMIGKGIMNIYGGLTDFADRTTKGSKPSKTCGGPKSTNEERNK